MEQQPIDLKSLEEAVVLFYRSEAAQQAAAHNWLTEAQASSQAWQFAWELMRPDKSCEVQFFGATTLHSKLIKHWHEVPKEMHNELKQKLLESIVNFGKGPKLVLNRLCISLSAFIVNMLAEWPTAIEDVVHIFQSQALPNLEPMVQIWIMMEVLGGIPEEANVVFTSAQRAMIRHEIAKHTGFVLNTVTQFIQATCDSNKSLSEEELGTSLRAVKCAGVWLKNGYPLDSCQSFTANVLKLVNKCYWNNSEGDGCLSAEENEVTEASLDTLSMMMVQPDAHRYTNSAFDLMRMFLDSLGDILKTEWKENNLNEDVAVAIYGLLIASVESQSRLLLSGMASDSRPEYRELYQRLIEEILRCTNKPGIYPVEESCSSLAMGFWYMLQDEVLSIDTEADKKKCLDMIRPLYGHLAKILVQKAEQPNETAIERWNSDDLETFRCYRQDISDTLIYCFEVLHDDILDIFFVMLTEAIVAVQISPQNWTKLEAVIFAFCGVAEHIDVAESKIVRKLMHILNEIPYGKLNDKLLGTALETIGSYCEWLKENPAYLPSAIDLLVKGLSSSMVSQATLGLKELTRECQMELKIYSEPLLEACQQSLQSGRLKPTEAVRLMYSVGRLMSLLSPEKIPFCLTAIVGPCFDELQHIIQSGQKTESHKQRTIFRLNMISTLYSSLNTKNNSNNQELRETQSVQPVLMVMEKTMPVLKQISDFWINEMHIIEALCNSLKYALTNLLNDFKPMLSDLCYLILTIFQSKCIPPGMDIARTCITMFHSDPELRPKMQQFFVEILKFNFIQFDQIQDNGFSEIADTVEAFFNFNAIIVKKIPIIYSDANVDCKKLILIALKAMTLPENGPCKYSTQFLSHFVLQSRNYMNMTSIVLENGDQLINTTIMCIASLTPRAQVEIFGDIFLSINKKYPSEFIAWLKILQMPNYPSTLVSEADKNAFMNALIKEKVNKRLIQSQIREFSAKCRGV